MSLSNLGPFRAKQLVDSPTHSIKEAMSELDNCICSTVMWFKGKVITMYLILPYTQLTDADEEIAVLTAVPSTNKNVKISI